MAKQAGPYFITGTIDNLTFYKMDGKYYARRKSSLDDKRVKKDKVFRRTMENAACLGMGSRIAKIVYWMQPEKERRLNRIGKLTGEAMCLLKNGKSREEALRLLQQLYLKPAMIRQEKKTCPTVGPGDFADRVIEKAMTSFLPGASISVAGIYSIKEPP